MKKLLGNQSGVALIMVMTALIILMALWGEFTFESKLSRIKTTNMLDKSQARLLAESGLELAMTRLKLYKEAYNTWQQNQAAKDSVSIQLLNQLWEVPFAYPIPILPQTGAQAKAAIEEFQKDSLLEGEIKVSVQNVSNKLNLNMMRLSSLKKSNPPQGGAAGGAPGGSDGGGGTDENGNGIPDDQEQLDPNFSLEQQLVNHFTKRFRDKGEEDEGFRERYGNIDPMQLIANLKYYISDKNPRRENSTPIDLLMDNSEQLFNDAKVTPKHGPMSAFNEIYLIPGWDDALVELIKSEFDVFPLVMIDLNKLTENMLRLLIPTINDDEVKDFFKYRDDPNEPHFFNTLEDFKRYIVDTANILNANSFDELFSKLKAQGIQFGAAPTLFRILSEGKMNRSVTTLVATVSLPVQAKATPPAGSQAGAQAGSNAGAQAGAQAGSNAGAQAGSQGGAQSGSQGGAQGGEQTPQLLLDPRIIELQVN